MMRVDKKMWLAGLTAALVFASGTVLAQQGSDAPLMKGDAPPDWKYEGEAPGTGKALPRGWEAEPGVTAPPQIPHDVTGLTITPDANACLGCHNPQVAPSVKAKAVPETHFRTDPYDPATKRAELNGNRYYCPQCHAPQANVKPLVKSVFVK
ncbi:MAG: hypothetical protein A2V83_05645 [Nitrospirae bacterium RBG_16_64_22]|nr:MAG: hypothetical protein A2V83_05645 [Nitrospirae bacterium RBG_16_64_22]